MAPFDLVIADPSDKPSVTLPAQQTVVYNPSSATQFPVFVVAAGTADVTVDVVLEQGTGSVFSGTTNSATKTWTSGNKTFQIIGPVADVNALLADMFYQAPADEDVEIPYTILVTDDNSLETTICTSKLKLVPPAVLKHYKSSCTGDQTLSGTTGTIAVLIKDENDDTVDTATSTVVSFNTDLATTVDDLVANIDANTSVPNVDATDDGGADFSLCLDAALGETGNGWTVEYVFTGDLAVSGTDTFDGGVTGKTDPRAKDEQEGDDLFERLLELGGDLIGPISTILLIQHTSSLMKKRRQEEAPVKHVRKLLKGRITVNSFDAFDPDTRVLTDTFADWQTGGSLFDEVFTDDPALCLLDYLEDTDYGNGNIIVLTTAQRAQLHEDIWDCLSRNITSVNSETRYTINVVVYNQKTRETVIQDLASIMHGRVIWHRGVRVIQDRPASPVALFNQSNVLEPGFDYSGSGLKIAYDSVTVSWHDLTFHSKIRKDTIKLTTSILPRETVQEVIAWGVAQEGQALRHGKKLLIDDAIIDPITVTFTCGPVGDLLLPGDIIRIGDSWNEPLAKYKTSGRVLSVGSSTILNVDRDCTGTVGENVYFHMPDFSIHPSTIASLSGANNEILTINDATPDTPVTKGAYNIGDGKLFKIVRLLEKFKGAQYEVVAVRHDPTKYATIDVAIP